MENVSFADNLYGDAPNLAEFGGCGLFAVCHNGAWFYERHSQSCRPGMWRVGVTAEHADDFWPVLNVNASAVVDDFGSLRMVEVQ